jgi:hypothetical protein
VALKNPLIKVIFYEYSPKSLYLKTKIGTYPVDIRS